MTPGNLEFVDLIASMVTSLSSVSAIIVLDERRLRGEELARAWLPVSRDAAIFGLANVALHPVCVLLHFVRTRRSWVGVVLGFLWLVIVVVADLGAQVAAEGFVRLFGI